MSSVETSSSSKTEVKFSDIPSVDHSKVEMVRVRWTENKKEQVLDFPDDAVDRAALPPITIITITRNRKAYAPLAIDNWKRIYYPDDKLTWLIIDDSDDPKKDGFIEPLKALKDHRIMYWYEKPKVDDQNKTIPYTVGYKRNLAMKIVKTDLVAFVDDDDYIPEDSILSRVLCLKYYGKECVYSNELGIYDVFNENSYVLEGFADVPEGSMVITRSFWEHQKFGEGEGGEGRQMVSGQELKMIRIPWIFSLIVLNHKNNTTGRARSMRFKPTRNLQGRASIQAPINLFKTFPSSFKDALKRLKNSS